jgi:hypothetical protein
MVVVVVIAFFESQESVYFESMWPKREGGMSGHDADGMSGLGRSLVCQRVAAFDHCLHYPSV